MRLIDADETIKLIEEKIFDSEVMCPIVKMTDVLEMINNQPTAYDVDKVVKQLEKKMNHSFNQRYKAFAEATEIVKEGGAE